MLFTNTALGCFAKDPAVVRFRGRYYLYYTTYREPDCYGAGIAVSDDMEAWRCSGELPQDTPCEAPPAAGTAAGPATPSPSGMRTGGRTCSIRAARTAAGPGT